MGGVGCGVDPTLSVPDPILGARKGTSPKYDDVTPTTRSAGQESALPKHSVSQTDVMTTLLHAELFDVAVMQPGCMQPSYFNRPVTAAHQP